MSSYICPSLEFRADPQSIALYFSCSAHTVELVNTVHNSIWHKTEVCPWMIFQTVKCNISMLVRSVCVELHFPVCFLHCGKGWYFLNLTRGTRGGLERKSNFTVSKRNWTSRSTQVIRVSLTLTKSEKEICFKWGVSLFPTELTQCLKTD